MASALARDRILLDRDLLALNQCYLIAGGRTVKSRRPVIRLNNGQTTLVCDSAPILICGALQSATLLCSQRLGLHDLYPIVLVPSHRIASRLIEERERDLFARQHPLLTSAGTSASEPTRGPQRCLDDYTLSAEVYARRHRTTY